MGLDYLLKISFVEDDEVFKICLDYWNFFVPDVYSRCAVAIPSFGAQLCFYGCLIATPFRIPEASVLGADKLTSDAPGSVSWLLSVRCSLNMLCVGLQREHRPGRCQCAVCLWRACRADKWQAAALRGRA